VSDNAGRRDLVVGHTEPHGLHKLGGDNQFLCPVFSGARIKDNVPPARTNSPRLARSGTLVGGWGSDGFALFASNSGATRCVAVLSPTDPRDPKGTQLAGTGS
jgi:hypothetical protein